MTATTEDTLRAQLMAAEILNLRGRGPIRVEIEQFAAFQLIGALQLAWRNPGLSDNLSNTIESFGRGLGQAFEGPDTPQLAITLEQGWHREFDR